MPPICQYSESHGPRRPIAFQAWNTRCAAARAARRGTAGTRQARCHSQWPARCRPANLDPHSPYRCLQR
eukprot:1345578-Prymnesium_polylepis.1